MNLEPIDLITRPSTPNNDGLFDDLLDQINCKKCKKRKINENDDEDIIIVDINKRPRVENDIEIDDNSDDPILIDEEGENINRDFPHHHNDCYYIYTKKNKKGEYCPNCYCSV